MILFPVHISHVIFKSEKLEWDSVMLNTNIEGNISLEMDITANSYHNLINWKAWNELVNRTVVYIWKLISSLMQRKYIYILYLTYGR